MMFYRANERVLCCFITPVRATTFNRDYGWKGVAHTHADGKRRTQGRVKHRLPRVPPSQPGNRPQLVYFFPGGGLWLMSDGSKQLQEAPNSSSLPSCTSKRRTSPQISGPNDVPAASQAAEITAEEANSSSPGIHIVAALQWDRLRQISS